MLHFISYFPLITRLCRSHLHQEAGSDLGAAGVPQLRGEQSGLYQGTEGLYDSAPHPTTPTWTWGCVLGGEAAGEAPWQRNLDYSSSSGLRQLRDGRFYCVFSLEKEEEKESSESHAVSIFQK